MNALALVLGGLAGFLGSRRLRRPDRAARAAAVARSVGGSLGRRKGLSAPELQRACFSEMVRHVRVTRQGRTHAPARYVLRLHAEDLAVVEAAPRWFTEGLADALRQAAGDNGWVLDGPVEIGYESDPSRHPGVPEALAVPPHLARDEPEPPPHAVDPTTAAPGPPARRELALVRTDTHERVPLAAHVVTIGRSRDRVILVDDSGVSRAHARIEPRPGGWFLIDEGSANGTRVNGTELPTGRACRLEPGDVVGIGPVDLRVADAATFAPPAGTRALDDSDRTRISGEVLPPARDAG